VAIAQYNLGLSYVDGTGVAQDYGEAIRWLRTAANQGEPRALRGLGVMYAKGMGVSQDLVLAYQWLDLAVTRFSPTEQDARAEAVRTREKVAADMTSTQITEAQRLARDWKPQVRDSRSELPASKELMGYGTSN
jgi:TPR repeat protein